jgi:CBS domain containing-hemolysin-like protein
VNFATFAWLAVAGLAVATAAACGAKVLHHFSRHELEEYCRRRQRRDRFREILDHHEYVAVAAEALAALGTSLALIAGGAWLAGSANAPVGWVELLSGAAVGALVLVVATIWIPWAANRLGSAPLLYHTWRMWRVASWLLAPLLAFGPLVDALLARLAGRTDDREDEEEAFEDEIRAIVTEGQHEGLLEADAREMIEGVIELGDVDVSSIMTPRSRMDVIQADLSWREMLQFVSRVRRTRIPAFRRNLDDVVGILYVKDLLPELALGDEAPRRSLRELLRTPLFVPKTKRVDDMLQEFLRTRSHMAIVLDEYRGVAGLVTLEDVLEEIVGEIIDESDKETLPDIRLLGDRAAEVLGRVHLDELNERLHVDLPDDEEFDTVGGLVFSRLGHVPRTGEQVTEGSVRITVLEATRRRIERVRVEILEAAATGPDAESQSEGP